MTQTDKGIPMQTIPSIDQFDQQMKEYDQQIETYD